MKRELIGKLALVAVTGVQLAGCETRRPVVVTPTGEIIAAQAPPAPQHEVIGIAPSASHVWIPGYYSYQNGRYVWLPGRWETSPRTTRLGVDPRPLGMKFPRWGKYPRDAWQVC